MAEKTLREKIAEVKLGEEVAIEYKPLIGEPYSVSNTIEKIGKHFIRLQRDGLFFKQRIISLVNYGPLDDVWGRFC